MQRRIEGLGSKVGSVPPEEGHLGSAEEAPMPHKKTQTFYFTGPGSFKLCFWPCPVDDGKPL